MNFVYFNILAPISHLAIHLFFPNAWTPIVPFSSLFPSLSRIIQNTWIVSRPLLICKSCAGSAKNSNQKESESFGHFSKVFQATRDLPVSPRFWALRSSTTVTLQNCWPKALFNLTSHRSVASYFSIVKISRTLSFIH